MSVGFQIVLTQGGRGAGREREIRRGEGRGGVMRGGCYEGWRSQRVRCTDVCWEL